MGVIISEKVQQVPPHPNWVNGFQVPSTEVHMVTYAHIVNTSTEDRKVRVCEIAAGESGSEGNAIYWDFVLGPSEVHAWGKGMYIPPGHTWVLQADAAGVNFKGSSMGIKTSEVT